MHEKQHHHASPGAASQHDDDVITSAPRLASSLSAPDAPIASGLLHRKARDENGVAAGAEGAVAAAASSSGQALPDTLMRKFESSLGTDLSSVRVHTGAESAAAAEAVGARAYTVGQDIHFGAGQYDPASAGGEHLLAHEVAHTVQQAGGPAQRQHKLEVSQPHDPMEHEADRAADAMVAGSAFAVSGGSAGAARKIARKNDWSVGGKPTIGDGFAKFQVDGSFKSEKDLGPVTVAGQLSGGLEAEVKWKPDATSLGTSAKAATGKDGKTSQQYESEFPVWKAEATKLAQLEAEKTWSSYLEPVEASVVAGVDISEKPGVTPANRTLAEQQKKTSDETKLAASVGIKFKTKTGDSYTIKLQAAELAKKDGKPVDISGPALKANYDLKAKLLGPVEVKVGDQTGKLSGYFKVKPELTLKPNYTVIAEEVARRGAQTVATEAAALTVETLAVLGPPAMMAIFVAHGIYIAGEKGKRDAALYGNARDATNAAMVYAQIMTGCDVPSGDGPLAQKAAVRAKADVAAIAARRNVSVEALMTELRQTAHLDFRLVYGPARQQAMAEYTRFVSRTIADWRKEHWFQAAFTQQSDDEHAVMKNIEQIWAAHP